MMKYFFVALLLLFALSLPSFAQNTADTVEAEILKREQAWRQALLTAGEGLEDIYSKKLTYNDWNGAARERDTLISDVKSGQLKYKAIKATKETVQSFLHTTIYTGEIEIEGHYGTTSISRVAKLLHVWVKEAGTWRLVVHQTQKAT